MKAFSAVEPCMFRQNSLIYYTPMIHRHDNPPDTRTHVNPIKRNGPYSSASASTTRFERLLEALLVWFVSCWKVDVFELNSGRLLLKSSISVLTYYLSPPKFPTAFSWRTKNLQICLSRICRSWHKMTYNLMNKFAAVYRTVITLRHIRRIMAVVVFFSPKLWTPMSFWNVLTEESSSWKAAHDWA